MTGLIEFFASLQPGVSPEAPPCAVCGIVDSFFHVLPLSVEMTIEKPFAPTIVWSRSKFGEWATSRPSPRWSQSVGRSVWANQAPDCGPEVCIPSMESEFGLRKPVTTPPERMEATMWLEPPPEQVGQRETLIPYAPNVRCLTFSTKWNSFDQCGLITILNVRSCSSSPTIIMATMPEIGRASCRERV